MKTFGYSVLGTLVLALSLTACGGSARQYKSMSFPGEAGLSGGSTESAVDTAQRQITARKLIKNASLTIEVDDEDDMEGVVKQVATIGEALKGYTVEQDSDSIQVKVPNAQLEVALGKIEALGEVTRRNVRAVDVTARFADLQIRIGNLQKLRIRFQALIEKATEVKDLISLEKELGRITGQLEQLQGQLRLMDNQTTYATIRVRVETSVSPGPVGWVFYGAYKAVKWLIIWD